MLADRLSRPRLAHPLAWWGWGLACAAAASRTTNPWYLLTLVLVVAVVVTLRRELGSPVSMGLFAVLAATAVVIRVLAVFVFGSADSSGPVLLTLPEIPLPDWLNNVHLGGPVRLHALVGAAEQGLQLGTVLLYFGACNVLAEPRRLLRYVPESLRDIGTALVVALTLAPQLARRARQVRLARRLRGEPTRGLRALTGTAAGVLEGALEGSLDLAAAMESRGYGRATRSATMQRRLSLLTLLGCLATVLGVYGLLDAAAPPRLGPVALVVGMLVLALSLLVPGRARTSYRRDGWGLPETLIVLSGVAAPVGIVLLGSTELDAAGTPGVLPGLVPGVVAALVVPVLAGVVAPRTPRRVEVAQRVRAARTEREKVAA